MPTEHPVHRIEMARYQHRATTEHEMAKAPVTSEVAAIHEWLASKYERLADQCQADAMRPNVHLAFPSVH